MQGHRSPVNPAKSIYYFHFQLIFLHGLGDTGHGWASAMGGLRTPNMKVICPTAQTMPVTLNQGFPMPSWFDLFSLDINGKEDEAGIKKASALVHKMIQDEIKGGIEAKRIILGGFSQGGALALYSALTFPQQLAGVMALSCWLPLHASFPGAKKTGDTLPVLQCHGDADPIVPFRVGQMSAAAIKAFMKASTFNTYRGLSHSSSDEELADMKKFIEENVIG